MTNGLDGVYARLAYTTPFTKLADELYRWRTAPEIQLMQKDKKNKDKVLDFVKGLRLSSQIIYAIRECLSEYPNVEVNWGHLVSDDHKSCSPECDIVVHRKGQLMRWNGDVMDFRFVRCANAVAVISCKSETNRIDKGYCQQFTKYGFDEIYLMAECCKSHRVSPLTDQAKANGYKGFHYLYTFDKKNPGYECNNDNFLEFVDKLQKLASKV